MSKILEAREKIDRRLDKLQVRAEAMESQLSAARDDAVSRLEQQKQAYRGVLDRVGNEIDESKEIAAEVKQDLQAAFDHAQVQLALGKAETRDAVEEQQKKIKGAVAELEATVDRNLSELDETIVEKMIAEADRLDAEFEAMEMRLEAEKEGIELQLAEKKSAVEAKIQAFKNELTEKKETAGDKLDTFEADLKEGFNQISEGFRNLLK